MPAFQTPTFNAAGTHTQAANSTMGMVWRPQLIGQTGGYTATPETMYDNWLDAITDPDDALRQDGNFDKKLIMHPDVSACMNLRAMTVSSLPTRVEKSADKRVPEDVAQEVADYVTEVLANLPNRRQLFYMLVYYGVLMGGQGIEFLWVQDGDNVKPVDWQPVHKTRFVFDRLNRMALLTRETPVWGSYVGATPNGVFEDRDMKAWAPLPIGKFMYAVYKRGQPTWTRPSDTGYQFYGIGEDVSLWLPVSLDAYATKWRMKWLEKHGMPLTKLYHPDNQDPAAIMNVARSIRNESVIRLPKPAGKDKDYFWDVEFQDPPTMAGVDAFTALRTGFVKPAIEKILLCGANIMEVGENGSYSAIASQKDTGPAIAFRYDAQVLIDEPLNKQLIPAIVRGNAKYRDLPLYAMPHHLTEHTEEKDQVQRMDVMLKAAQLVPVPEDEVYKASGVREPKKGEDGQIEEPTVFNGQPDMGGASDMFGGIPGSGVAQPGVARKDGQPVKPVGTGGGTVADDGGAFAATDFAADFNESDHPRGQPENPGQFAPKGGGQATSSKKDAVSKPAETPNSQTPQNTEKVKRAAPGSQMDDLTKIKLRELGMVGTFPPAEVAVSDLRVSDLSQSAEDLKYKPLLAWDQKTKSGRISRQYRYTQEFHDRNAAEKFDRVNAIAPHIGKITEQLTKKMMDEKSTSKERDAAAIASCIRETGLRPTDGEDSIKHRHFGISSLQARHIKLVGDEVHLDFIGKEGVRNQTVIRGKENVAYLKQVINGKDKTDFIFAHANSGDAGDMLKEISKKSGGPGDIKIKDLRTLKATEISRNVVQSWNGQPPPLSGNKSKDAKAIASAILKMSGDVSKVLNNTPTQARDNYIHPEIFKSWQQKLQAAI